MSEPTYSFGTWVRLRRQALVLTREELASRVGCAEVTIRKIEADERKPSPQVAELLAQQLGLPDDQRELFVRVARGMLPVEQLPPPIPGAPVASSATPMALNAPESTLPRGTVTFLFTDIEGSTKRWEQQPEAMRMALAHHDTILHAAITAHNGHVFKTVGDAFCAAFASAPDALLAAVVGQRTLIEADWGVLEPIRVRMALHTGTAEPQAGDYLGQPLNRIARLLAAGHGGQILLSLAAHELVRDHLPAGTSLRDLGSHRLKDLVRPESIFQANAADLPPAFPPLQSLDVRTTNLPFQVNALIGRTQDVAVVRDLLGRTRLVTLTGTGGTGKTRLALQIGAELLDQYPDGVWFVDLSPLSDPEQIASAIAQVLGVPESPDRPLRDGVVYWLRERHTMLLLDNCEQVIAGAADLVAELLRGTRQLAILATSRIPLRIAAEHEYAVAPLGLPDLGVLPPLDQLSQYDAVALFATRARAVRADFTITNANAPAIAEICTRLDGLPLAIELAAARIRFFAPDQLLSRLVSARMQTLMGGPRDLPTRQQTIRSAIDWSYHLLTPAQQTLFARLSVFVGGWTLDAAEVVCRDSSFDVIEELAALVEQSLVRLQASAGELRYTMLETIRTYALERLAEHSDVAYLQQRHAEYFTLLAEESEPYLRSASQMDWLLRLDAEYENIRAVLDQTLNQRLVSVAHRTIGVRLAIALWYYWLLRNRLVEGLSWLNSPEVTDPGISKQLQMDMLLREAWLQRLSYGSNSARAEQLAQHGLRLARELGDDTSRLMALLVLVQNDYVSDRHHNLVAEGLALGSSSPSIWWRAHGMIAFSRLEFHSRPDAAQQTCETGLALAREVSDTWLLVGAITARAAILPWRDTQKLILLEEAVTYARQIGDWLGLAQALGILAMVADHRGDFTAARSLLEERLQAQRFIGNLPGIVSALVATGNQAHRVGDLLAAERIMEEATALAPLGRDQRSVVGTALLVRIALDRGEYARARSYADHALMVARSYDDVHAIGHFLWLAGYAATINGDFTAAEGYADELLSLAHQIKIVDARGYALEIMGMIALQCRNIGRARLVLEECRALRQTLGEPEAVNVIWTTFQLSCTELISENYKQASIYLQQCLHFHRQTPFAVDLPPILETSAALLSQHNPIASVRLWGTAEALRETMGSPIWPIERPEYQRRIAEARVQVDPQAWGTAWAAGRAMTWEQAADEALIWLQDVQGHMP